MTPNKYTNHKHRNKKQKQNSSFYSLSVKNGSKHMRRDK